jgi:1-phosphofructokinase
MEGERTGGGVAVFAPAPLLTITVEALADGAQVHLHPGGQGFWVARMVASLGVPTCLCGSFGGEVGGVVQTLIAADGLRVRAVTAAGDNGAYLHDRRSGERRTIVEVPASPLARHEVDALYGATLDEGLAATVTVLGGPAQPDDVPSDTYRRLASDLRAAGRTVVADLSGPPLAEGLRAGVDVLKVSHEELLAEGRAEDDAEASLVAAVHDLAGSGAANVVVTRQAEPLLALLEGRLLRIAPPDLQAVDPKGAGDSLTAGTTAGLARGLDLVDAVRLGAAAGALNATRHGLGTGDREVIERLADHVGVEPIDG